MSPSGKALGSGPSIRGFESLHPSQIKNRLSWSVFKLPEIAGFETPDAHPGVKIASGNLQGNNPMKTVFSVVIFRGRGT